MERRQGIQECVNGGGAAGEAGQEVAEGGLMLAHLMSVGFTACAVGKMNQKIPQAKGPVQICGMKPLSARPGLTPPIYLS